MRQCYLKLNLFKSHLVFCPEIEQNDEFFASNVYYWGNRTKIFGGEGMQNFGGYIPSGLTKRANSNLEENSSCLACSNRSTDIY